MEGLTGWSIGNGASDNQPLPCRERDAEDFYSKLESAILPLFYGDRASWLDVMRHTIALNASYFNTHRMVQQYVTNAYLG